MAHKIFKKFLKKRKNEKYEKNENRLKKKEK